MIPNKLTGLDPVPRLLHFARRVVEPCIARSAPMVEQTRRLLGTIARSR
jgi:hypothetical protein